MTVLFQAICITVIPVEKIEMKRHVFEVFIQILIVIAFYVIINFCIYSVYGDGGFMKPGGRELFIALMQGMDSTFSFIVIMIVDAFLIKRKIWRFRLLSILALIIFFYSLYLEGFRVMSFMIFVVIGAFMFKCEDKEKKSEK